MAIRSWLDAAWELLWGILKRFYLWIVPLAFLQPIDLLDKVGVDLVIPDMAVFGLVALGVAASAIDILRGKSHEIAEAAAREDARAIAGVLEFQPYLMGLRAFLNETAFTFQPAVHVVNNSQEQPVRYRLQRFEATIGGDVAMRDHDATSLTLPPKAFMEATCPGEFGPYPVTGVIVCTIVVEFRFGKPFSNSTVVEQMRFSFRGQVTYEPTTHVFGCHPETYSVDPGPEFYVAANIDDESADWTPPNRFPPLEPGPEGTGVFYSGDDPEIIRSLPANAVRR